MGNLLAEQNLKWKAISAPAVSFGPGNFTGVRNSVSAARGLAFSLGIPEIGISTFETMRDPSKLETGQAEIISLKAPKETAYIQHFHCGKPQSPPLQIDTNNPLPNLVVPDLKVRGTRAEEFARPFDARFEVVKLVDIPQRIAICAEW